MSAKNKKDTEVSPMEAQNTAQRRSGPSEPPLATAEGGTSTGSDRTDASPKDRSVIRKGGEAEARDDR